MDKAALIDKLNEAISLELGALLQYNQYSHVLLGEPRRLSADFFKDQTEEALDHARRFASKVVALGGTPSVEPDAVKQTTDIKEMLRNSLETERRAVRLYTEALALCDDSPAYRNLLEDQIQTETDDVEELEKYLNQIEKVESKRRGKGASKAG